MKSSFSHLGQRVWLESSKKMDVATESVRLIITSPPYWNLKDYGAPNSIGSGSYENYLAELNEVWDECFRVAEDGAALIINVNSRRVKGKFYPIAFDIVRMMQKWTFWDHNIWYIPNALPQPNAYMERLLDNKFESLLVFIKGDSKSYKFKKPRVPQKYIVADPRSEKRNSQGRCLGNILRIPAYRPPNVREGNYHIAAFPEELVAFYVSTYTDEQDNVLDPFLGSGTTLKVCRVLNRNGLGFELNPEFAPLIKARIAEDWRAPDWRDIDVIHSTTMKTGSKPRKSQFSNESKTYYELDLKSASGL